MGSLQQRDEIRRKLETALSLRYDIERRLGEGGMAFVFLGKDVKHERQVAIKVLKPELAASLGAERFLREIQITAKLQHPNILPLYDSGEAEGLLYYIMPFVVGESLSDLIAREKQLGILDAVQITREVAEALGYAHSYGLIHRDIKPNNVMMSNGHAIVADFGIARAMSEAGADKLTQTGMAVGTPAYMSPEQATGDADVDGRADIYSVGCVFYEMLVGQVPFTGPNAMAIMARHSRDNITAPSIMRQSIPPEVEDIIFRSMEKLPADRYRTANEMVQALKAIERGEVSVPTARASQMGMRAFQMGIRQSQTGMRASQMGMPLADGALLPRRRWPLLAGIGGAAVVALGVAGWLMFGRGSGGPTFTDGGLDPRDIAVLYFDDLSSDSSLASVADGITEGLIDQLGLVRGLQVISRNGVTPYRRSTLPRDSIARALKAGTVVIGSVEAAGSGSLRFGTRLVDGNSGEDIERASFQLPVSDLLAAQDSVVGIVTGFLRQRIGQEVRVRELRSATRSVDAWSLLQRGVRVRREAVAADGYPAQLARLVEADSLFRLAAAADPKWPEPTIQRGWVAWERARRLRGRAAAGAFDEAIALAQVALAADPSDARALELRGTARFWYYEAKITVDETAWKRLLTGAREDLEAATTADPELASAHLTLSRLYYFVDDVSAALISAQRAYSADAYLERANDVIIRIFWGLIDQEQFGQADTWCARGVARFPRDYGFVACQLFLMVTPAYPPDVPRAWQLVARMDSIGAPAYQRVQASLLIGGVLAKATLVDSARAVWARAHTSMTSQVDPEQTLLALEAYVRTLAKDEDEAIELLKRAVAANPDHDFAGAAGRSWWWATLRQHPRWREVTGGR